MEKQNRDEQKSGTAKGSGKEGVRQNGEENGRI
jgi:hypothetical protein